MNNLKKPDSKGGIFQDVISFALIGIVCALVYCYNEGLGLLVAIISAPLFILDLYTKHHKKEKESYLNFYHRNYFFFLFVSFSVGVIIYIFTRILWLAFAFFIAILRETEKMWAKKDYKEDFYGEEE